MLIYVAVFCVVVLQGVDALCAPSRVNCKSNNSYTFCVDLGYTTVKLESVNLKCPDGLFCSEKHYYPCVPESEVPPIGGLPEPVTTATPVDIATTQETVEITTQTIQVTTKIINQTLIPPTQSQSTTLTPPITLNSTLLPPSQSPTTTPILTPTLTTISIINTTTAVPSTLIPSQFTTPSPPISTINSTDAVLSTLNSSLLPPSQSPTTTPIITPTLTTISIINSTTAVPSTTNPSTLIPSTQSQSTSIIGDNQTTIVTTTAAPVVTASSRVPTTQVPTLPPCPNPSPGVKPMCQRSGTTYPGPICTKFYECVPIWLRLEPEERICAKGRAYSVSQRKCVIPPDGCICAN